MSEPERRYRPNVGVVLFNAQGLAWLGLRRGWEPGSSFGWQFPQGGVDEGEALEAAARRELFEETGARSVALLGRAEGWLTYDFPPEVLSAPNARGFHGQRQAWFAFRFTGDEAEIDLDAHGEREFDSWRWADLAEAPAHVVPFKREVYMAVVAAFAAWARPSQG